MGMISTTCSGAASSLMRIFAATQACKPPEFWLGISPSHTGYATYEFPTASTWQLLGFQWNFSEENITLQNNYAGPAVFKLRFNT